MKGYIAQRTLGTPKRLTAVRYTGALFAVAVGVLLAFWLQSVLDASVVLLMAILVTAWFSGFWPALLASVLAMIGSLERVSRTLRAPHSSLGLVMNMAHVDDQ